MGTYDPSQTTQQEMDDTLSGTDPDLSEPILVHPLQVEVVRTAPVEERPYREWSTGQVPVPTPAGVTAGAPSSVQVVAAMPSRGRLTIRNIGANPAFVGPTDQGSSPATGYALQPNAEMILRTRHEVRATSTLGTTLSYYAEHLDG